MTPKTLRLELRELARLQLAEDGRPLWWREAVRARARLCQGLLRRGRALPLLAWVRLCERIDRVARRRYCAAAPSVALDTRT